MRHSQRTSPAVAALLLALGADARHGLDQVIPGAPNNILFPDTTTTTLSSTVIKWGDIATGNSAAVAANLAGASSATTVTAYSAYTGGQGSCVDCVRSQQVWCSRYYLAERATAFTPAVVFTAYVAAATGPPVVTVVY